VILLTAFSGKEKPKKKEVPIIPLNLFPNDMFITQINVQNSSQVSIRDSQFSSENRNLNGIIFPFLVNILEEKEEKNDDEEEEIPVVSPRNKIM